MMPCRRASLAKNVFVVLDGFAQFGVLGENLVALQPGQALETQIQNGLRLDG